MAGSIALIGFGLDSFVESLSGSVMIWRFRKSGKISEDEEEKIEKRATRLIAYSFYPWSLRSLWIRQEIVSAGNPGAESFGNHCGHRLHNRNADFVLPEISNRKSYRQQKLDRRLKETLACVFLSIALLTGLVLNYLYGLWQADPIVGLVIVIFLIKEGYNILKGEDW